MANFGVNFVVSDMNQPIPLNGFIAMPLGNSLFRDHVLKHGSWMGVQLPQHCAGLLLQPGMFSVAEIGLENVAS